MRRTGVWLLGAHGNVATTAMVGARAIAAEEVGTGGLVTAQDPCHRLDLPPIEGFVFGGHDVSATTVSSTARMLSERATIPPEIVKAVDEDLERIEERIETGTAINCGRAIEDRVERAFSERNVSDTVARLREEYRAFVTEQNVDRLVVVNVSSTEPPLSDPGRYDTVSSVERAVADDDRDLPASSLYAYAALLDGYPYINFTPSTGASLGGLKALARRKNVPHMGRDGKTGETLLKSALAPMFARRNLRVRSWEGHNILGNADGRVLEDEANEAGKLASKSGVLDGILDEEFHNRVRIDYTPPLGDWKTAWDDIRFSGFLDTPMKMQFTWEGSDSILAAPLVLDLIRLIVHADEHGEGGLQPQLASFFKSPLGVDEHDLSRQFGMLTNYVNRYEGIDD
ncbi:inositol-3-phosphate synthase [Halocatena salina]|uniref:Inositol-3-phosphate synthase n=1 Tax=Halocatena salina TaxID=2934340 RepID=A0A8U0A609_9EURY|nr:inositol-3-phosphate synthase [Halocatena salina]UPM44316.1 inositol-3-phosphate synthase [Halocatena salina]